MCRKAKALRIQLRALRSRYIWRPHIPSHPIPIPFPYDACLQSVCIPDIEICRRHTHNPLSPLPYTHATCAGVTGEVLSRRWISIRETPIWIIDTKQILPAADSQGPNDAQIVPSRVIQNDPIQHAALAPAALPSSTSTRFCLRGKRRQKPHCSVVKRIQGAKTSANLY
ncbi:hypothetical protein N431DRAFT_438592 [Stipitochalara longipes BDJ]|nr:hypothetical protein N431DRAFT_438592 [Stipitochalara longipes BDJ]